MQAHIRHTNQRILFVSIIAVALLAAGSSYLIPVAAGVENEALAHLRTAIAFIENILFLGVAVQVFSGLRAFKTSFRAAYIYIAVGYALFGIALVQLPIIGLLNLWATPWSESGAVILPFMLACLAVYLGVRRFATLLHIESICMSRLFSFPAALGAALFMYALATIVVRYESNGIEFYIALVIFTSAFVTFSAVLSHKIQQAIGPSYRQAIKALTLALVVMTIASLQEGINSLFIRPDHIFLESGAYLLPFLVAGLFAMRAGYHFGLLSNKVDILDTGTSKVATDDDYLDSIVNVAELAAQPRDIDPILDDFRIITSGLQGNDQLTKTQKQQLLTIYYKLEAYLTHKDPLRTYTYNEVREHVAPAMRGLLRKVAA